MNQFIGKFIGPAVVALALVACAQPGGPPGPAQETALLRLQAPVILLGEVHDNAAGHRLRLAAFDALLAGGALPALLLEPFERGDQPAIDAARARQPATTAAELVDQVLAARPGGAGRARSGWEWPFYEPFIARALRLGLPIVPATLSRADARLVMRDGLAAHGFDPAVPAAVLDGLARDIEASHCGMLDTPTARRMALAQVARDQQMARLLQAHATSGAVLLAGNGHVRTDLGAPRWLDAATRARSEAIGVLEPGEDAAPFDRHVRVPAQERPDPCAGMQAMPKLGESG